MPDTTSYHIAALPYDTQDNTPPQTNICDGTPDNGDKSATIYTERHIHLRKYLEISIATVFVV